MTVNDNHIIVDKTVEVKRIGVIDAPSLRDHNNKEITDHKLVYCEVACRRHKEGPQLICYRDYSKFDVSEAVRKISNVDWRSVIQIEDVDDIEFFITSKISQVFDELAPMVCKRVTWKKAPWRDAEIVQLTKVKNKLRKKYWNTMDVNDWNRYKETRNRLNGMIWRAKKKFFSDKLSACDNPKEFWACLKQSDVVGGQRNNEMPPGVTVEEINKYFVEMGHGCDIDEEMLNFFMNNRRDEEGDEFHFVPVDENEIKKTMNEIRSKAVGSDNISIDMIKAVSPYAIEAITHLVNQSLRKGIFPRRWKMSIVKPLLKVTKPKTLQQLRPISILPAMSKILEKVAVRQMINYVDMKEILPKLQSGGRKNHSTCTALVNLCADLYDARDKGECSTVTTLDYTQAYDSMHPKMFIAKMRYFGFGEDAISFADTFFEDRQQVTRLGNETSPPLFKRRGDAQGRGMATFCFDVYTADMPRCLH